ncbi:uncharacterized protein LOC144616089 isoform X2 [Panthera onca]
MLMRYRGKKKNQNNNNTRKHEEMDESEMDLNGNDAETCLLFECFGTMEACALEICGQREKQHPLNITLHDRAREENKKKSSVLSEK